MSDFDFEKAAQTMFGDTMASSAPQRSAPTAASAPSPDQVAERLFGQPEPYQSQRDDDTAGKEFSELTEAEQAQRLYGGTDPTLSHADATLAIRTSAMQDGLADPEEAAEIAAEWAETFAEHQISATQSKELADLGASVLRSPPTAEVIEEWTDTAVSGLQATYGIEGAGQALQDARAYVSSHPGLADTLNALGLGSHPKIVALAAEKGRAMRLARR